MGKLCFNGGLERVEKLGKKSALKIRRNPGNLNSKSIGASTLGI